jgi:Hydrogenase/urease nickel incorporation, metallochaperone, hypA
MEVAQMHRSDPDTVASTTGDQPIRELSIAQSVVDIATRRAAGRSVRKVELSVGRLREIDPDNLHLAFGLVTQGTALDGARLQIDVRAGRELLIDALELEGSA